MICEFGRRGLSFVASSGLAARPASSGLAARPAYVAVQSSIAHTNRDSGCWRFGSRTYCRSHDILVSRSHSWHISKPERCLNKVHLLLLPARCLSDTSAACQQRKAVTERKAGTDDQQLTLGKKVAETSKTVSYGGIILVGLGVIGMVFFTLGKELFSSKSPNGVYTKSLKICKSNLEIQDCLGTPIKGYGEMTRRRRRRHVSHLEYSQDGVNFLRMKFYLEGPERKGTVHLEMKENESGRYEYRYLFVELDGYPSRTIVLEDNR